MSNEVKTYIKSSERKTKSEENSNISNIPENSDNSKKKNIWIILSIAVPILIGGLIVLIVLLTRIRNKNQNHQDDGILVNDTKTEADTYKEIKIEKKPLEMQIEYKINTNANDLKRIYVNQRYYEDLKINGILSKFFVDRKTNYDIYIISEIESDEETKNYYNKTYICSISISSECVSTEDEFCIPSKLVDLIDQDYSHVRVLEEAETLEDFPLPLCFFNMTDNNVITSIACHKNISESRVNSIVLDLYFFRPPGIKRLDRGVIITTDKKDDKEIIREINEGPCDIENSIGSVCTTDMNTTKNLKGDLLMYDEEAKTNVTTNEDNYYLKTKNTHLIDKTEYIANFGNLTAEKYNETLFTLYPYLKDYLKYYEHFSLKDFEVLYDVSNGVPKNKRRILYENTTENNTDTPTDNEKPIFIANEKLFNFTYSNIFDITINNKVNVGYNTAAMEASNNIVIGGVSKSIDEVKNYSDINIALDKLISLSKAGNNLATILYDNIIKKFNNITETINIKIPIMMNLITYKELTDIFDSTFSLNSLKIIPKDIIEESNKLINKLEQLYTGIDNGSLKRDISILNDYIYNFIKQSNRLVNKISDNMKELGELLKSPKQTIADISLYYLNNTSTSYIDTINKAKTILMNYYINQKDLIIPEVDKILEKFETTTIESIKKQIYLVNNLTEKFDNMNLTIKDALDDDYIKITTNLNNSNLYLTKIIDLFKTKVKHEIPLKDEYFISKYDIESNKQIFNDVLEEALLIAKNLDDNEYVDKTFDDIMTDFRKDFNDITKYMEEQKEEQFPMDEKTLNGNYFKYSEQETMSEDLKNLGEGIINKINNENNKYLNLIKEKVDQFLLYHKDTLFEIYYQLSQLFSEVKLGIIDNLYEKAFNGYLNKISNDINSNIILTENYYNELEGIMENNNKIIEYLQNVPVNKALPSNLNCEYPTHEHCWKYTKFVDSIANKYITQFYKNKYNTFKAKFDYSKEFINGDFHIKILQEYKSMVNNLKESLQTFKNNKIGDKYPELFDLYFVDEHIKNLDDFYSNLNKYISDDRFNNYYLVKLQNYKTQKTNEINGMNSFIDTKNNILNKYRVQYKYENDFCTGYYRKKTYICNNGAIFEYDESGLECFETINSENYNSLISPKFNSDIDFKNQFNDFYISIKQKIDKYNGIIFDFKKNITDVEMQIIEEKITFNYLSPIFDKTNSLLSEKFSDNLIKGSYNYYKSLLDNRLENLLNTFSNKWISSYDKLKEKINLNKDKFKNSITELGLIASIYNSIISQNMTISYYDSIIEQQKNEFNYTISYYYNILLQNITSVYQTILNQIPTNQEGFNNILELRKKEINEGFNNIISIIKNSKKDALTYNYQTNSLEVSPKNFFKTNSILSTKNTEIKNTLNNKINEIDSIENGKSNNKYSLICRFYLENSLNGWQISDYFEPVSSNTFIKLKLDKFKSILSTNWIFDQDNFVNKLNLSIYNTDLDIKNDFLEKKEEYKEKLEKKITELYSKDTIIKIINDQYSSQIKLINNEMKIKIKNYIQNILENIKGHLINEENRIKVEAVSFSKDFSQFNQTFQNIKDNIINELKKILHKIVNDFYDNMISRAYKGRIESGLNEYYNAAEKNSFNCTVYETLKSSFNIGETIFEIVKNLVNDYKNFTFTQIKLKNEEYIEKKEEEAEISVIKQLIDDELNPKFLNLLNSLEKVSVDNVGNNKYDFSNEIKNNIDENIIGKMNEINNTVQGIKGDKYHVDLYDWPILDYSRVDEFENIAVLFNTFISNKIDIEKKQINILLKEAISDNFNTLIKNLILSFGTEFFDRILRYNENFKITTLYQDLKYTLVVSLLYYGSLNSLKPNNIDALTLDLKIKLYNLNNLDSICKENNKKILNLLNNSIDDFIKESSDSLINDYKSFLKSDAWIKVKFNNTKIIDMIDIGLKEISSNLEKDFITLLNEEFKTKFIDSYTKIMNKQTNDMIQTVDELKQTIKSLIDDLFSSDIEEILNKTNNKMNETLNSINQYNTHFNSFKIPDQLINFFESYGDNTIQRAYDGIETFINTQTKNLTLTNLEKNSKKFEENINSHNIIKLKNETYDLIQNNFIENILEKINGYGINEYPNNLNIEIDRINSRTLRRLNGEQTEEDSYEEYHEKVADASIDENFHGLLNQSQNTLKELQTNENFNKTIDIIKTNIKRHNISYKESQQIIYNSYRDDEMYDILNNKLEALNNLSLEYYNDIEESFSSLKKSIEESLIKIYNLLNRCANITYITFANKYENISKEVESVDIEYDEPINKEDIESKTISQNNEFTTNAKFSGIKRKAKFKFDLITEKEGDIKKPRIEANVINGIRPDNVEIKISNLIGTCGEDYQLIIINFNNIANSMKLNFDTKSTFVNVTSIADFDSYTYSVGRYLIEDTSEKKCICILNICNCSQKTCDKNNPTTKEPLTEKIYKKIYKEKFYSIEG